MPPLLCRGIQIQKAGDRVFRVSPNKRTADLQAQIEASGDTPLDFLLQVMRNPEADFDARFEAAKAAAPYVHPRLQAVDMKAEVDGTLEVSRIELVAPECATNDHAAH